MGSNIPAKSSGDGQLTAHPGRILCVTSNLPRWVGDATTPFVLHLAQDLQALGWQVDLLAPHAPGAATRELLDGVPVERFRYLWPERQQSVCYQGGALINLRRRPLNYLKLPALVIAQWQAVARRLASRSYDILHSHWILPQGFVGRLAGWRTAVPHVITAHGGDVFGLGAAPWRAAKRWAIAGADALTVNSSVTEAAVRAWGDTTTPVHRIPMGVAMQTPTPMQQAQAQQIRARACPQGESLLLFTGRLVEEKGVADLLQAMAWLHGQGKAVRLLILGEGQDRGAFERLASALGLAKQVCFTGWIESAQLSAYRCAADVLIAPSRTAANGWVEAQGLSVLEAMADGLAVIATASGGVIDVVEHDKTGVLVPEGDPLALAQHIDRLLMAPQWRAQLTQNARARIECAFSRQASARAFAALFTRLSTSRDSLTRHSHRRSHR